MSSKRDELRRNVRNLYEEISLYDEDSFERGMKQFVGRCSDASFEGQPLVACKDGVDCPPPLSIDPAEGVYASSPWVKYKTIDRDSETEVQCIPQQLQPIFRLYQGEKQEEEEDEEGARHATSTRAKLARMTDQVRDMSRIVSRIRQKTPTTCESAETRDGCYAVREEGALRPGPTGFHQKCFWKQDYEVFNNKPLPALASTQRCQPLRPVANDGGHLAHVLQGNDARMMQNGSFDENLEPEGDPTYDPDLNLYRTRKLKRTERPEKTYVVSAKEQLIPMDNRILPLKVTDNLISKLKDMDDKKLQAAAAFKRAKHPWAKQAAALRMLSGGAERGLRDRIRAALAKLNG